VITIVAQRRAEAVWYLANMPLRTRLANAAVAYAVYLRKTFWPSDLCVFYPHPRDMLSGEAVAASVGLLLGLTAFAVLARRRQPALLVGWLWFLGTLVPVIGLVQVGEQALADRYTYIPLVGVFIALAWGPLTWVARRPSLAPVASFAGVAAVVACAVTARGQLRYWRDTDVMWQRCLAVDPNNYLAHFGAGGVAMSQGRYEEAEADFLAALAINPNLWTAHHNLGLLLSQRGDLDGAIDHLSRAARGNPRSAMTQALLGLALARRDGAAAGVGAFRRAVEAAPAAAGYRYDLAWALSAAGQSAEAEQEYRAARAADPTWPDRAAASAWRLATDANLGRRDPFEAVRRAEQAAQATGFGDAHCLDVLAAAYAEAGRFEEAERRARQALDLLGDDPAQAEAIRTRLAGYREHRAFRQGP
jgi:tetratricopeptide (TPR) repeat protein